MRYLKNWKVWMALLMVGVFMSLYGFIYFESIKQPSEAWSGSIVVDTYDASVNLNEPDKRIAFAVALEDRILYVSGHDREIQIRTFNEAGKVTEIESIETAGIISEIAGEVDGNKLLLTTFTEDTGTLVFYQLDPVSLDIERQDAYTSDYTGYNLSSQEVTLYKDNRIDVYTIDGVTEYTLEGNAPVTEAASILVEAQRHVTFIRNDLGSNKLGLLVDDITGEEVREIETIKSKSTTSPTNMQILDINGQVKILVTMMDSRTSTTELRIYTQGIEGLAGDFEKETIDLPSYNGIPYYSEASEAFVIGIFDTNLGRTEVARGKSVFPNYYMTPNFERGTYTQLTNTEMIGRTPSFVVLNGYDYLIHNEYAQGQAQIYMTSTNPDFVKRSQKVDGDGLFEIFIRTAVNYPAIMFSGILPTVSILLPVLAIALPFMMLKLSWVERNKTKTMLIVFGMYTLSKFYVYYTDIFASFSSAEILPAYLTPPIGHWGVMMGISALTMLIAMRRGYEVKERNESFIKSLALYILLDVTVLNLFFLPYTII
ncbi:hypothetical protein [Fusibacter sp. JL216-2]|uniref:hypothetical protein n=1 Tax=Fusibacter sp. JL216-2 TaxID=3071453 RepID=UPI003D3479C1